MIILVAYCAVVMLIGALCIAVGIHRSMKRRYPEY